MNKITMIAAVGKNGELGKNNTLIWHFKEDMTFFKEQTMGHPIAMGINTLNSLPKLLPERKHIVLTSRTNLELDPSITVVHSVPELLEYIQNQDQEVMIIGGAKVYSEMIPYADKLILTEIEAEYKEADAYFPEFNHDDYNREVVGEHTADETNFKHVVYQKKLTR